MEFVFQFLLVLVLVLLNAYFVASEFALVAVRKTRINELARRGNRAARLVQSALEDLDSFISSTQLGITIASLSLGWIGEPAIARFLEPFFTFLPQNAAIISAHSIAVAIAFFLITFLHIVLGELAPKTIALQRAEIVTLVIIAPLAIFTRVFRPFIFVLNGAGNTILKMFGFTPLKGHQLVHSEEEIKMILAQSVAGGAIEKGEADMVSSVFRLGDISVKQIMIPRTEVIAFNVATTLENMRRRVEHHLHSRFPVYEHSVDNVIGFVHIKDIYRALLQNKKDKKISDTNVIREIITIPEVKRIDDVLLDMRKKSIHIAIVEDEYGGTAGIVTLEDIIESLVGEIQDEFESPRHEIHREKNGSYLIDGLTPLEKIQNKFNLPMKGQGYTTIGGLTFGLLGREAKKGDFVQIGNISITVQEMARKRIKTIILKKETLNRKKRKIK